MTHTANKLRNLKRRVERARKILEESAAGRVYPSISIEFAKEALGIAA